MSPVRNFLKYKNVRSTGQGDESRHIPENLIVVALKLSQLRVTYKGILYFHFKQG